VDNPRTDDAMGRIRQGVDRKITRHERGRAALVAGGVLVATVAGIGTGLAWPAATGAPYISCQDSRVDGAFSTGVGFDMRDPIGFCLDYGDYHDASGLTFNWSALDRDQLVACRLADGVAGVFVLADGDCDLHGLAGWTPADAATAAKLRQAYDQMQLERFGIPIPSVATTPSQILPS